MISKPKGCNDIYGAESKKWQYINKVIDTLMEKYNYTYIRTPLFEASDLFHRGIGEGSDIVRKETYDFIDRGDRHMTLRPEGTAGIVRSFIENKMYGDPNQPTKVYYNGTMYRYERPQSGRDRELTQFGVEVLGSDDSFTDAEVISIAYNLYKILGLKNIEVHLNSLGDVASREAYKIALKKYLEPYLNDLCDDCNERFVKNPLRILDCKVDKDSNILKNAPKIIDYLNEESKKRFDKVIEYLNILNIEVVIDPSIVRGLDYYTHTVFEIIANIDDNSQNVIGAGGRYNTLVEELGGPNTPCVGFASGIGRIVLALEKEKVSLPINNQVDVYIMYVNEDEKMNAIYLTNELRLNGFIVETNYLNNSLKAQFKQADRLNAKYLLILNSEDLNDNLVNIKNNQTKEEEKIDLDYLIYYLDEKLNVVSDDESECSCDSECHCHDDESECSCHDNCHCHDEEVKDYE